MLRRLDSTMVSVPLPDAPETPDTLQQRHRHSVRLSFTAFTYHFSTSRWRPDADRSEPSNCRDVLQRKLVGLATARFACMERGPSRLSFHVADKLYRELDSVVLGAYDISSATTHHDS